MVNVIINEDDKNSLDDAQQINSFRKMSRLLDIHTITRMATFIKKSPRNKILTNIE